jgi:hypothetical protein
MIETIFIILSLLFAFGFLLMTSLPNLPEEKRNQAWKPALLSVACAIAAMVAIGCL